MTMTQMIGSLERAGWRFMHDGSHVHARPPKPRPADASELMSELKRRKAEALGFLRSREEAFDTMRAFGLPEIPVFEETPPPEARVMAFRPSLVESQSLVDRDTPAALSSSHG